MAEDDKTGGDKPTADLMAMIKEAEAKINEARATKRPKALLGLRKKISQRPATVDLWQIIRDFHDTSSATALWESHEDRACVLLVGAVLEQALESAILSHCIELDDDGVKLLFGGGDQEPLSTAAKIRLGYALGIYGEKSRKDLDLLRVIRNTFAHSKSHMDFLDHDVIAACANLTFVDRVKWGGPMGDKPTEAREEFVWAAQFYFLYLTAVDQGRITRPLRYTRLANPETYA